MLAWHFPNRGRDASVGPAYHAILPPVLGNAYAQRFPDAAAVAGHVAAHLAALTAPTRLYRDTVFATTAPAALVDSAAGRVAVKESACSSYY